MSDRERSGNDHWTDDYSREELIEKFARDTHQEVMISELSAFDEEDIRQEAEHHAGRAPELGDDAVDEIVERVQEKVANDLEQEAEQDDDVLDDETGELPDITEFGPQAGDSE